MSDSIVKQGDVLLIVHRRMFDGDESRYFVGEIDANNDVLVQVTGYTWSKDPTTNIFIKKDGERTKIFSLSSGTFIVYKLKNNCDCGSLEIVHGSKNDVLLVDKNGTIMDLTEKHHYH